MSAINEAHRDFAKALVALARAHKMNQLHVTFSQNAHRPDRYTLSEPVEMRWQEGRDLAPSQIHITAKTTISETVQ